MFFNVKPQIKYYKRLCKTLQNDASNEHKFTCLYNETNTFYYNYNYPNKSF